MCGFSFILIIAICVVWHFLRSKNNYTNLNLAAMARDSAYDMVTRTHRDAAREGKMREEKNSDKAGNIQRG